MEKNEPLNNNLKLIIRSSLVVFFGVGISKILTYLYRVIVARSYGPEIYGLFSLAMMVSGFFIALSSFGLPDGLLRYIAIFRGKKQTERILYSIQFSLALLFLFSLLFGVLLFFLAEEISVGLFHNKKLIFFLQIFSLAIPFTVLSNIFLSTLRAYEKISMYSFITNVARNAFKVLFLIFFIFLGLENASVIFSHVMGAFALLILSYSVCKRSIQGMWRKVELSSLHKKEIARGIFSYSWPVVFVGVMQIVLVWLDSFFIGYYKSAVEVGFYAAAVPLASLLHFVPELFMQLFFPLINKIYVKKDLVLVKELSKQVVKWIYLVNLPIFILIFVFPESAIGVLFGEDYLIAAPALRILVIGIFIASIVPTTCYHLLLMKGKSKVILVNTVFTIFLNALLNYFFIPMKTIGPLDNSLGINGAALATLISILFSSLLILLETRHYVSIIPIRRKMLHITGVAIISAAFLIILKFFVSEHLANVFTLGVFFFLCYTLLLLLCKCLDKNDLLILSTLKDKLKRPTVN